MRIFSVLAPSIMSFPQKRELDFVYITQKSENESTWKKEK